jgi:hypothetical protein
MSRYPEAMLLTIIGEMYVHNRLLTEELEIKNEIEREENENSKPNESNYEREGRRDSTEAVES